MRKMKGDPELCSEETVDIQSPMRVAVRGNGVTIGAGAGASWARTFSRTGGSHAE
jgi:hypothetical protein